MLANPQIAFTDECHSFVPKQSIEKRDPPKRVPRSPNAFMLYRSDLIQRRTIPPEVERRQQNLSRIAGQCWNMLSETEKAIWFNKAAVIRAEHRAKYKTGPPHRDTNKNSEKGQKRESGIKSTHPSRRSRRHRTRTLYCEGMFAALHNPKFSTPEPQASLFSPTYASESPLSTTASLSPTVSPHLLSPFTFSTPSIRQESPSARSEDSVTQFGSLLDSPGQAMPLLGLSQIVPSKTNSPIERLLTLRQHEDDLPSCVPRPGVVQVPSTLSETSIFPTARYPLTDYLSSLSSSNVADFFPHFNQSLYP